MRRAIALTMFTLFLGLAGCSRVPFERVKYVSVKGDSPTDIREQFAEDLHNEQYLTCSIVFRFGFRAYAALGLLAVNDEQKTFTAVGLSPVGLKLFELAGNADAIDSSFAIEQFSRMPNWAQNIAGDIRAIYFDRVPPTSAQVKKSRNRVTFVSKDEARTLEYVFAGPHKALVRKRCFEDGRLVRTIHYREYTRRNGKLYPDGILLKNHRGCYSLIIRLKEVRQ
ncbi:DUF3261 domain-containing protein [bacterium]|nr:DUF3261 domain-containing protein [bacterium]